MLSFSVGRALTLVAVGFTAAASTQHASNRRPWRGMVARCTPSLSGLLIIAVGIYVGLHGWAGLSA